MMMTGLVPLMMSAAFAAVTALLMVLVTATATSLMSVVSVAVTARPVLDAPTQMRATTTRQRPSTTVLV